jgi:hypothetical protein
MIFKKTQFSDYVSPEAERKKRAKMMLISKMTEIVNGQHGNHLKWKHSLTDLVEVTHLLYLSNTVCDEDGKPYSFIKLLMRVCGIFDVRSPANPYSYLSRIARKKGKRYRRFIDRYKESGNE